jgi:signal transduction histidine kinase
MEELQRSRQQVSAAETQALRKIERDLHDGPQQQLLRLSMDLATASRRLEAGDQTTAAALIQEAQLRANQSIADLRALSRGIAPPVLQDRGLVEALRAVAAGSAIPVELHLNAPSGRRLPAAQENALYFSACELLSNAAKHSGATGVQLELGLPPGAGQANLMVSDAGQGGAVLTPGHGLAGLRDRLEGLEGAITIESNSTGTVVQVTLPVTEQCG